MIRNSSTFLPLGILLGKVSKSARTERLIESFSRAHDDDEDNSGGGGDDYDGDSGGGNDDVDSTVKRLKVPKDRAGLMESFSGV